MTTLNLQVGASGDDGNFSISGGSTFQTTSTVTSVGNISGTTYGSWFRFTGVSGLAGKTILSASLQVWINGSFGTPLTQVRAERANAPANPTSRVDAIGRTRTTAKVDWDNPSGSGYTAKDITSVIQELADNHDPSDILIFWEDDGGASGAWTQGRSWDNGGSGAYAAKLDIVYVVVIAAGAPADIQFEGTVSTYVTVTPIVAGAPADIQFGGFPSTFTMQVQVGAPGDVQFEGTVGTFTMQVLAGAPVDIQFTGFATTPVATLQAGASAAVVWEGFPTLVVVATITCDPRTLEETLAGRYGPVAIRHRFEWLDRNLVTVADISRAIEYARVQLDNNRAITRTCQMRIRPSRLPNDFDSESDHIAVYAEVNVAGEWQRLPLGVFHLDYIAERLLPNGNEIWEAQGVDLSSHLYESEISETFVLPAGTNYVEAVAAICVSVGLGTNIEPSTYVTPARFVWPPGSSRGNIANDLLRGINYYPFWATAQGAIRSREWLDPYAEPPAVTYSTNEQPKMIRSSGLTRIRERARFVNRAIVTIADPGRAPATVQVTNDDQDSIVSTVNKGAVMVQNVVGDRIVDTAMMAAVGASLVRDAGVKAQGATFQSFPDPRRDAHEFYTLVIDDREDSTPWRVESWDYECKPGTAMIHRIARASRIDVTTEVLV